MALVAVTSPRSSPGATSLCVGLAMAWQSWGLEPLLIEADPAGGVLGHRYALAGPRAQRTLLTFAVDTRRSFRGEAMAANVQKIADFEALVGPVDPRRAAQAVKQASPVIAEHVASAARPVVADLGRILPDSPAIALAQAADSVLIVLEPRSDQIQAALYQIATLRRYGVNPQLVLVGDAPFSSEEVAQVADARVLATLPHSPKAAVALGGGKYNQRAFSRSPLWRSIAALARDIGTPLPQSVTTDEVAPPEAPEDFAPPAPAPVAVAPPAPPAPTPPAPTPPAPTPPAPTPVAAAPQAPPAPPAPAPRAPAPPVVAARAIPAEPLLDDDITGEVKIDPEDLKVWRAEAKAIEDLQR